MRVHQRNPQRNNKNQRLSNLQEEPSILHHHQLKLPIQKHNPTRKTKRRRIVQSQKLKRLQLTKRNRLSSSQRLKN